MFNGIKKLRQSKVRTPRARKDDKQSASYSKGLAKREEILTGLMSALAAGRLRNPSLRVIGKALGLEPAHILYYFGSREELLQQVILRWDEGATADSENTDPVSFDLEEYVAAIGRNVTRSGIVHLYLALATEAVDPEHPAHDFIRHRFDRLRKGLARGIQEQQAAGKMITSVDPDIEARLMIALADGLQLQSLIDPQIDAVEHLSAALAALRPAVKSE